MGFLSGKTRSSVYSVSPVNPTDEALRSASRSSDAVLTDLEKKDKIYKRRIRILRLISRIASLILNSFMLGSLSYSLSRYLLTRYRTLPSSNGTAHIWADPTKLWPTLMLLAISAATLALNLLTICTYACGVGAANRTSSVASVLGYAMLAAHVVVWGVSAGAFKMASDGRDLWGWSCGATADAIQAEVRSFMDFGVLCTIQQGAWYTSIIQAAVYAVTFLLVLFMVRRASHKKKMERAKYPQQDKAYQPPLGRQQQYAPVPVESPHV